MNTGHPNWVEEIKKQNDGNGIDLIIDFVGAPYFQSNLDLLAQDGRVVMLGLMGGSILPDKVNVGTLLRKRARVEGSTLRSRSLEYQIRLRDLFVEKVMPGLLDGTYEHHTEKVFDWEDVVLAHEMMERNETKGKLVCVIN